MASSTTARIKCLKLCDWVVGGGLLWFVRPSAHTATPIDRLRVRRILVIRPGGLGDAILAIPFIKEVKRAFPQASIDLLAERRNAQIFSCLGQVIDHCHRYDQQPLQLWRALRAASYDLVFDTEQWHQLSALLATATEASVRVGFDTNPRRNRCYSVLVPYSHEEFEGTSFLRMLSAVIGEPVQVEWDAPFLDLPPESLSWAQGILRDRRVVAIALRGGIRERCWEPEKIRALLPRLLDEGLGVCLLGTPSDGPLARTLLEGRVDGRLIDLTGKTSIVQTAAVLRYCRLLIATDSGLVHLAYAVGTPSVALFGAGIEAKWAPRGSRHRILNHHLPCSPCTRFGYTPRCPINVQCLREISVDEVFHAAIDVLHTSAPGMTGG